MVLRERLGEVRSWGSGCCGRLEEPPLPSPGERRSQSGNWSRGWATPVRVLHPHRDAAAGDSASPGSPRHLHPGQAPGGSQPRWGAGWERCSLALHRGTGARVPGDRHRSPPKSGRAMGRAGRHVQGGRRVRGGMFVCFVYARTKISFYLCTYRDMKNCGPHPACPLSHAAGASFEDFHC